MKGDILFCKEIIVMFYVSILLGCSDLYFVIVYNVLCMCNRFVITLGIGI